MSHGLLADSVDTSLASLLYSCTIARSGFEFRWPQAVA